MLMGMNQPLLSRKVPHYAHKNSRPWPAPRQDQQKATTHYVGKFEERERSVLLHIQTTTTNTHLLCELTMRGCEIWEYIQQLIP